MILLPLLLLGSDVAALLDRYRARTTADIQCRNPSPGEEIVVCGARKADRYRVTFIDYELGDPRREGVEAERERLQNKTTPCQERGAFLIGCGSVGVKASARFGRDGITNVRVRPQAR
ncbi:MAG: hypothetical protein K2P79_13305 [Sphingomonas sp.]|nr:hypothetical protein [Sphingomonas sp.]